jgi:zinc protease
VKRRISKDFISVCLVFICLGVFSSDSSALNVNRAVLQNGLTLLHSENHSLPIVMVTLIIKTGQLDEPEEQAGLGNLVAELMTEGTKNRTSKDISEGIDFIGASLDASASNDYMTLKLSVLKKDIQKGFELFADVLLNPTFLQSELDRKRELIKGFLRQSEEEPSFVANREFRKAVFGDYPYGRLVEGSAETLDSMQRDDLVKFYSEHYLPNNAILSLSGDLSPDEVSSLIDKYLCEWKEAELLLNREQKIKAELSKKVIKIDRDLTQANIVFGGVGISRNDPNYYAVSVMNYILGGGGFSSRLIQTVRDDMGLAYDIHSIFDANKETGFFQVGVQTKNESANITIHEILKQLNLIKTETVSDEELAEAKSYLTGSFPRRLDTNRKIADFLALVEFYGLGIDYAEKYPQYINSVTKDDVLRVARKYLPTEQYILVVVANQDKAQLKY